jgi:hypothetical protein
VCLIEIRQLSNSRSQLAALSGAVIAQQVKLSNQLPDAFTRGV